MSATPIKVLVIDDDAALREAKVESDRRSALALEEIGIALKGIAARYSGIENRMETEAVDVAVATARKLCGALIAREPLAEVTALVSECFAQLVYADRGPCHFGCRRVRHNVRCHSFAGAAVLFLIRRAEHWARVIAAGTTAPAAADHACLDGARSGS